MLPRLPAVLTYGQPLDIAFIAMYYESFADLLRAFRAAAGADGPEEYQLAEPALLEKWCRGHLPHQSWTWLCLQLIHCGYAHQLPQHYLLSVQSKHLMAVAPHW